MRNLPKYCRSKAGKKEIVKIAHEVEAIMPRNECFDGDGRPFSAEEVDLKWMAKNKQAIIYHVKKASVRWYNLPARLEEVVERLRNIRIEKRDARELLRMFANRPATLVYLDPPYFMKRDHGYAIDANDREFHIELLETCISAKCMILLSGYDNQLYREMLRSKDGWKKVKIETHTRDTTGKDYAKTEVLWMNSQFLKAKKTGAVPLRLTRKEIADNKINPQRKS